MACILLGFTSIAIADSSSRLNITEQDGSPSVFPWKLKVTNGSLTDNLDGTASLATGLGGGGGLDPDTTSYIHNQTTSQLATMNITSGSVSSQFNLPYMANTNVVVYEGGGGTLSGNTAFKFFGSSVILNGGVINMPSTNIFMGNQAGGVSPPSSSLFAIGIGNQSTDQLTTGISNTALGNLTHDRLTTGSRNTSIGAGAGDDLVSGNGNTCLGASNGSWQPCQSVLTGSSNTMVGAGAGSVNAQADDAANTFIGFSAGNGASGSPGTLTGAICIGANCEVDSSKTAQIGGTLGSGWEVNMHVATMTVDTGLLSINTVGYSWPRTVGASGGLFSVSASSAVTFVSAASLNSTQTWTGGNTYTSPLGATYTFGVSMATITLTGMGDTQIPYFASGLLSGSAGLVWDNANTALRIGGASLLSSNALNIDNGGNGAARQLSLNSSGGTGSQFIGFFENDVEVGNFGIVNDGGNFRWRINGTTDRMTLDSAGLLKIASLSASLPVCTDSSKNLTTTGCGGVPSSPSKSVQFNNAGAFGGSGNFNWSGTSMTVIGDASITGKMKVSGGTATDSYIVQFATSTVGPFFVSISTMATLNFSDQQSSGTVSSCGTGPSFIGGPNALTITPGSAAGGCTYTFPAGAFKNTPICLVVEQTMSLVNVLSYTVTNLAVTVTQTALSSKLDIQCTGRD